MCIGNPASVAAPRETALHANVPNPFNHSTRIPLDLAAPGRVRLQVYDVSGRLIRSLLDEPRSAGTWSVQWDGRDANGMSVSSGVYIVKLTTPDRVQTRRVTLLK